MILQKVHGSSEFLKEHSIVGIRNVNKTLELSVCTFEVKNFMNMERVVKDQGFFYVKVPVKDLIQKVGSLVGSFSEPDIFSFADGLDFQSAQNDCRLLVSMDIVVNIFSFLSLVDLTVNQSRTESLADIINNLNIIGFTIDCVEVRLGFEEGKRFEFFIKI